MRKHYSYDVKNGEFKALKFPATLGYSACLDERQVVYKQQNCTLGFDHAVSPPLQFYVYLQDNQTRKFYARWSFDKYSKAQGFFYTWNEEIGVD